MKALIVEDERKVGQFVAQALAAQSYTGRLVGSAAAARTSASPGPCGRSASVTSWWP